MAGEHRYGAVVEYDGTDFLGYQIQAVGRTVQGEIETALRTVTQSTLRISGAGRTDAGVHATGQVIAFDVDWRHDLADLQRALNAVLPPDIIIKKLKIVASTFHPRFSAINRSYRYTVVNQAWPSVLQRHYTHHIREDLDVMAMNRACQCLLGSNDFASFGQPPQGNVTIREVTYAEWSKIGSYISFNITANAFLYRMVRRIVGSLLKVGLHQWPADEIKNILDAQDLTRSSPPAPARGLCLVRVAYLEDI